MMVLKNDSGLLLKYWTKDLTKAEELKSGTETPLLLDSIFAPNLKNGKSNSILSKHINLSLHNINGFDYWEPLQDIPLEVSGPRLVLVELEPFKIKQTREAKVDSIYPTLIALEIFSKNGFKTINVRSTIKIQNSTNHSFFLTLSVGSEHIWRSIIDSNSSLFIPANVCSVPNCRFDINLEIPRSINRMFDQKTERKAEIPVPEMIGTLKAKISQTGIEFS
jgi:hypothetical protein